MSQRNELFTTHIRKATRKLHSINDALVNAKFAISLYSKDVWSEGLYLFYHIFAYLEDAKKRLNLPDLDKLFVHNILYRKEVYEEDLAHYFGSDWRLHPKSPALENYLLHLQQVEKKSPQLLMAHVYHLYLGLLSGGQILTKKRKIFENDPTAYIDKVTDFSNVDIVKLKKYIQDAMNEIGKHMTTEEKDEFIKESNLVFIMSNQIIKSIGGQDIVVGALMTKMATVLFVVVGAIMAYKMYYTHIA